MKAPRLNTSMLSNEQIEAADTIRRLFLDAGFSEMVAAAAIVNAFRESSLDPKKPSPTGRYIGLFQLSPDIIKSKWEREQADLNTLAIIDKALRTPKFMEVADSDDLLELVEAFSRHVEHPLHLDLEASIRIERALMLYPDEPSIERVVRPAEVPEEAEPFPWWMVWLGAAVAAGVWFGRRK